MNSDPATILRHNKLKDTQPRRLVLQALIDLKKPVSHKDIHNWIKDQNAATNLVTVYRTLETFTEHSIVHRHPSSGGFILCSMSNQCGNHGFLSCQECGKVEEFCNQAISASEKDIAKKAGFVPKEHVSEIIGICGTCQ